MTENDNLKLAFYGDDFTGSTDALEFLTRAGAKTVLFLDNPTPAQIARFGNLDAVGVAGMTRAMAPSEMAETLREAFGVLKSLNPRHIHYKVCSTFDSSPEIGNIGTAIETGFQVFQHEFTPVLSAAPTLGRYSAFGNLYARMGIGSRGDIFRLDRHPSMRDHPVTPASESDLRLHLGRQTPLPMGLIDLLDLERPVPEIIGKLNAEIAAGKKIVFFDALYEWQMVKIGEVFDRKAKHNPPLFSVGSSGIEKALGDVWLQAGLLKQKEEWEPLAPCSPILILSGSVSPVTASQIDWAGKNGFEEIAVAPEVLEADNPDDFIANYRDKMVAFLKAGKNIILHTAKGPDDGRIRQIKSFLDTKGWDLSTQRTHTARRFGEILGRSAREALEQFPVKRLVIAGGDTSGYVARYLGIEAVEMIAPVFPGAPVCRSFAAGSPVDGIEVNLKGGQVGDETYFGVLQKGLKKT
ncbi:MAG TPA: four-carbon acid sugar kinase family protein [Flavilitoribacter sp.]|nr:four-carbon acid sugar kinase family protein [Flavilitoribacter sp.]HMQ90766.1 four-carbon acid sugar kinase family protein [Flavilitoribacter sp.]